MLTMESERWQQIQKVFSAALERDADERERVTQRLDQRDRAASSLPTCVGERHRGGELR